MEQKKLRKLLESLKPISHLKNPVRFLDGSVRFTDCTKVYVTEDTLEEISIGWGTLVLPNVYFFGKIKVGRECILWPNVMLFGKTKPVVIGDGVELGRPNITDSLIRSKSRIGSNAEITRSKIGPESTAQHWCYIGDTEDDGGVNYGAGTVTANYDGSEKKKTKIGAYAFLGINSSLVAPLVIGRETLVGAGAVITKDIPPHAIVVGHNRILEDTTFHRTKNGWKIKRKK
jgi:bifunctional UDP-N-acetylglucosamine pyrophosphorylase/glucosamine-1-phosphate N-acetyltransferase